jgi:hypothetical protein
LEKKSKNSDNESNDDLEKGSRTSDGNEEENDEEYEFEPVFNQEILIQNSENRK